MRLRPFKKYDWNGLAGCESFADGSEPLVGSLAVDGFEALVALDAQGLFVNVICPLGSDLATMHFPHPFAARAIAMIGSASRISFAVLSAMPGADATDDREISPPEDRSHLHCYACEDGEHDCDDGGDDLACPGCKCLPGDGPTSDCAHPLGCGYGVETSTAA